MKVMYNNYSRTVMKNIFRAYTYQYYAKVSKELLEHIKRNNNFSVTNKAFKR